MHQVRLLRVLLLCLLVAPLSLQSCEPQSSERSETAPVVAGLASSGLDARARGVVLLGELGCVACHAQGGEGVRIDTHAGPNLVAVGSRVRAEYLPRFLTDPIGVEPGTTMPDLLRNRDAAARTQAAEALAEYLRSFGEPNTAPEALDGAAAERGAKLFHEIGCAACHAPRAEDGAELPLPNSAPLGDLAAKYTLQGLRAFLLAPQDVRPSLRMPDLHLQPGEAHDIACYLLARAQPAAVAPAPDAAKVAAGRELFAGAGCASCHTLDDAKRAPTQPSKALSALDPARGCLGGEAGPWPHYALDDEHRAAIRAALRALAEPLEEEQQIRTILAARNCNACHARGEFGGVAPERNSLFKSNDDNLGQEGRLPPRLSGVGAKLQHEWLVDSVAYGQSVRPYLRTRMPGFGKAVALELARLFEHEDHLPPLELAVLPDDHEKSEPLIKLGRDLVGDKGMACINCHAFAGESVGMLAGIDLVDSTALRLRREWFTHFLRKPSHFLPSTLMPQYFDGEVSTRPEFVNGDTTQQIDALWHYLAQGRNVRKPSGMRHEPIQLEVGGEAVILRRSLQNTGKRAISVGLPRGVNYSFDAESLGLNQIWWGKFVDAAGVWTGQGSGEARVLSQELAALPKGPAFVVLADAAAAWPSGTRRELSQRFLGYDLDAEQRSAFRYVCEDVTITDAPQELAVEGSSRPRLRRTLSLASASEKTLTFRAALAANVVDLGEGVVAVGPSLRVHLPPDSYRVRAAGAEFELLVEIPIQSGKAQLVIDYAWLEESK